MKKIPKLLQPVPFPEKKRSLPGITSFGHFDSNPGTEMAIMQLAHSVEFAEPMPQIMGMVM